MAESIQMFCRAMYELKEVFFWATHEVLYNSEEKISVYWDRNGEMIPMDVTVGDLDEIQEV